MILGKINVLAIDKAKLFTGAKGKYLDIVLIETPSDQYGNSHMIVQGVTKEERESGVRGAILGNAKTIGSARSDKAPAASSSAADDDEDSIPF